MDFSKIFEVLGMLLGDGTDLVAAWPIVQKYWNEIKTGQVTVPTPQEIAAVDKVLMDVERIVKVLEPHVVPHP